MNSIKITDTNPNYMDDPRSWYLKFVFNFENFQYSYTIEEPHMFSKQVLIEFAHNKLKSLYCLSME